MLSTISWLHQLIQDIVYLGCILYFVTVMDKSGFDSNTMTHSLLLVSRPFKSIEALQRSSTSTGPPVSNSLDRPFRIWLFSCRTLSYRLNIFLTSDWPIYCWPLVFGFIEFFDIFVAGWHLRGASDSNIIQEYLLNIFIFKDSFYLTFSLEVKIASPQLKRPWWLMKHDSRSLSRLTVLLHPRVS